MRGALQLRPQPGDDEATVVPASRAGLQAQEGAIGPEVLGAEVLRGVLERLGAAFGLPEAGRKVAEPVLDLLTPPTDLALPLLQRSHTGLGEAQPLLEVAELAGGDAVKVGQGELPVARLQLPVAAGRPPPAPYT